MINLNNITTRPNNSVEEIIYRELSTDDDFNQCIAMQRNIFKIPDTHLISPLFLKLIARNNPPVGISLGVFKNNSQKSELLGFIIGFATFAEKSIHTIILGVKPEYNNKAYGYKLMMKLKDKAISLNLRFMYCVFEPLEVNLARLYVGLDGVTAIKYFEENTNSNSALSSDKLLVKWDFYSNPENTKSKCADRSDFHKIIETFPTVSNDYMPGTPNVLVEIPDNFAFLKTHDIENAIKWRNDTKKLFEYYINKKKYIVKNCITGKIKNKRKSYYLLEKNDITPGNI